MHSIDEMASAQETLARRENQAAVPLPPKVAWDWRIAAWKGRGEGGVARSCLTE